jgi:hypothetical protein
VSLNWHCAFRTELKTNYHSGPRRRKCVTSDENYEYRANQYAELAEDGAEAERLEDILERENTEEI